MATTQISDIIIPEIFAAYTQEITREKTRFFQSRIIRQDPMLDALVSGGGETFQIPFFQDLTSDTGALPSDTASLVPAKITAQKSIAVRQQRERAWASRDIASVLAGADADEAIARLVGLYWSRAYQKIMLKVLEGCFTTALASTHVLDVTGDLSVADDYDASTAASQELARLNPKNTIRARRLLGDETTAFVGIAMHSSVFYDLCLQDEIEEQKYPSQLSPLADGTTSTFTYRGLEVIVDDGLPRVALAESGFAYTSYIFGEGSMAFGMGTPVGMVPVETDRDSLAGEDYLINRTAFIFHLDGMAWTGNASGAVPSDTELATGSNWAKRYTDKNIRCVQIKTALGE